jgi:hypothetical protein
MARQDRRDVRGPRAEGMGTPLSKKEERRKKKEEAFFASFSFISFSFFFLPFCFDYACR